LITYQRAVSNQVERIIQSTGTYAGMEDLAAATLAGLHAVLARFGRHAIEPEPEVPTVMQIIALADEVEAEELGQVDLVRRALTRWGRPALPLPTNEQ
jgi:hypothetical protein